MTKLESLQNIKSTAIRLLEVLMGSDIKPIKAAENHSINWWIGFIGKMKI